MGNNWLGRLEMVELVYSNSPAEQNTEVHFNSIVWFQIENRSFIYIHFLYKYRLSFFSINHFILKDFNSLSPYFFKSKG